MKSDTLFYEKRHVVLCETTRRFTKKMLILFPNSERGYDECQMFRPTAIYFTSLYGLSNVQSIGDNTAKKTFPRTNNKEIADIFLCLREK